MALHAWWTVFGEVVEAADKLSSAAARDFAAWAARGDSPGIRLAELRLNADHEAVLLDIETERPQDLAHPIRASEPVAILFPVAGGQHRVLAVRDEFPDTPHQNWTPQGTPCSLCVDDRPWPEARLTYTPADLARRIQLWLAKAARGELHDAAQPPEPLFFKNWLSFVIPSAALAGGGGEPVELIGSLHPDNPAMVIASPAPRSGGGGKPGRFVVLPFQATPQSITRLRHAPATLAALAQECACGGFNLVESLRASIAGWAGLQDDSLRRLSSHLAIIIAFPVRGSGEAAHHDLRGFVTHDTAGGVGTALGVIAPNSSGTGAKGGYIKLIGAKPTSKGEDVRIEPIEVHFAFDRGMGAAVAGQAPDTRRAVLVGAGAIGSQVALTLAREGTLSWSVVDQDILLPHNLARHGLFARDTGTPKAIALARQLSALTGEGVFAAHAGVLDPPTELKAEIEARLAAADVIIDASASVAVSRHLSDLAGVKARRFSVFFNPAGSAAVLLAEAADRKVTLRDLEAQYHRLHLTDPAFADHLKLEVPGLRYSGSCRSVTNRIPANRASLLSAIAARGIGAALKDDRAAVQVWTVSDAGEVRLTKREAFPVTRHTLGAWIITYDEEVLQTLSEYRAAHLPNETGGVLLGITDVSRRSIHVAHIMPPPEDSRGTVIGFERGVAGLSYAVAQAVKSSMHQLRYVGEWHSHPRGSSPMPSRIDLGQIAWLGAELRNEGLPALMAIAADDSSFAFVFADMADSSVSRRPNA
jgi:proteasome lid subunit RPN8/RPN11